MKQVKVTLICIVFCICQYLVNAQLPFIQHAAPAGLIPVNLRMNDINVDANNNKWVAFGTSGLGVYDGVNWIMYDSTNGSLPTDSVICVDFDNSGNAWIGTKVGAIYKSGNVFSLYNTGNSGLTSNVITAVLTDGNTTWFGTKSGLAAFDGSNWILYNTGNSGLVNDSVTTLEKSSTGAVWVGTRNGLSKFDSGNWTNYTTTNSIINPYISDLEIDNAGRVWMTAGNFTPLQTVANINVFFIDNNVLKSFETDFYYYDLPFSYIQSTGLAKDINGNIAFQINYSSGGRVLFRVNGNEFEYFTLGGLNYGVSILGNIIKFDNNDILWVVPRFRFYFYSIEFNGYETPLGGINFKNHRLLDINEVKAGINASGDMHWDYSNPVYEVPKGSGRHSVFSSAFWIGGIDQGGQLHMAAQTYRQTGTDFWPGPIGSLTVPFDSSTCRQFDRIWKINKWKIEEFKAQFLAGNISNGSYQVPEEIATWPAKGNGLVSDNLAPFFDANGDGIYDVMTGDYPLIRGDQMLYYIFNDSLSSHSESGGQKMGVEIHASAYSFYCPSIPDSNQAINWTTFYNYQIINKSTNDYDSVYLGLWSDMDLGNATDDYVGCDSTRAAGFTMNGDNFDETSAGYGFNPPMQNVKILRGTLADLSDGTDNNLNSIIDEPGERTTMNHFMYYNNVNNSPVGNPNGAQDFYYFMKSIWLDGTPVTYGGSGYNSSNILTNFMYSGIPYSGSGWTDLGSTIPEDRRFVMSSGAFSLDAGDTATLDFAYVFTWDSLSPNGLTTSIARNHADLDRVQYWFENNNFPSCQTYTVHLSELEKNLEGLSAYPNPASSILYINNKSGPLKGVRYTVYNLLGESLLSGRMGSNSINISALPDQVYLLHLQTGSKNEYLKFIISSTK